MFVPHKFTWGIATVFISHEDNMHSTQGNCKHSFHNSIQSNNGRVLIWILNLNINYLYATYIVHGQFLIVGDECSWINVKCVLFDCVDKVWEMEECALEDKRASRNNTMQFSSQNNLISW